MRQFLLIAAILISTHGALFGQFETKGLALSLRAQGTSWKLDDLEDMSFDSHQGGGTGAEVYFGMSRYFGLFGRIDLSNMSRDDGDSYTLTHLDIGVRVLPKYALQRVRPYAELAFDARSAQFEIGAQNLEASGPGVTVGAGCFVFVATKFAVGLGIDGTFGDLEDVTLGGFKENSIGATSWRGAGSVVWFP